LAATQLSADWMASTGIDGRAQHLGGARSGRRAAQPSAKRYQPDDHAGGDQRRTVGA
jgi:hypothetical protein